MYKKVLIPLFLMAVMAAGAAEQFGSADSADAGSSVTAGAASTKVAKAAASSSQTAKAVAAAKAFKKTLTSTQQKAVQFAFSSSVKTTGWSNLPVGTQNPRNGLAIADLSAAQVAALRTLLKASLSSSGYAEEESIRVADDYLNTLSSSSGGGTPPAMPGTTSTSTTSASAAQATTGQYGSGKYYIALFGTPSASSKWTVQFGGHHLALHITFKGATITGTPYFVGVEPLSFVVASKSYAPLKGESDAMVKLFKSLSTSQLAAAKLSSTFDDVLLGPGQDGKFPTRQGQLVGSLSSTQQGLVTAAIKQWVTDVNTTGSKKILATYKKGLAKTRVAYATSIDPTVQGSYMRIDGPKVWIEIVSQAGVVVQGKIHYHSIWRDRTSDYGA